MDIELSKQHFVPSKGIIGNIPDIFYARKTGDLSKNKNTYQVITLEEPLWYNRPIDSEVAMKDNQDGIHSLEFPMNTKFIGVEDYKSGVNYYVPVNSVCILAKIDLQGKGLQTGIDFLTLTTEIVKSIVNDYGDESKLTWKGNDLYYNGKKFYGTDAQGDNINGLTEVACITCKYLPEKENFDRLSANGGDKPICGITEEIPTLTREVLKEEVYQRVLNALKGMRI